MFSNINMWICIFWFGLFYMDGEAKLRVSCDREYLRNPPSGSCLRIYREKVTWNQADASCKSRKGHLLKIGDLSTANYVLGFLPSEKDSYWIGLVTNMTYKYQWSLEQDVEANYVRLERHVTSKKNAVITRNKKYWLPVSGYETHGFICEWDQIDLCPLHWTVSPPSGTCIKLSGSEEKTSWAEARQRCQESGGDLVMVLNREMFNFVSEQFSARNLYGALDNKEYWLGLNDIKTKGKFQWLDLPDQVTYSSWDHGQPNVEIPQSCVMFTYDVKPLFAFPVYNWHNRNCTRKARYVCEKYSDCKNEKRGMKCRKNCTLTNCKGEFDNPGNKSTSCNKTTGHCLYGCEDGYQGVYCDIHDCKNEKWRMICPENCTLTNCKGEFDNPGNKNTSCNKTTGHCLYGCEDGYRGAYCDIHVIKNDIMKLLINGLIIAMSIFAVYCCSALFIECVGLENEEVERENENFGGFKEALQSDTVWSGQGYESEV